MPTGANIPNGAAMPSGATDAQANRPLRITYIVHHYPPAYRAGAEQYTHRVAAWMQSQGHDVEVVTLESINEGSSKRIEATRDLYEDVPVHRLRFKLVGAPDELTWRYDNPLLERWVDDYLHTRRPDFVHFMAGYLVGIGPLRAVHAAGIPMALTLHDYWFVCPRHTLQRGDGTLCMEVPASPSACARCVAQELRSTARADKLTAGLYSALLEKVGLAAETEAIAHRRAALAEAITWPDAVIAPTRFLASKINEVIPHARVRHMQHGYAAMAAVERRKSPNAVVQIGYLGQISQHKGVHVLIEAFRALEPASATLHIYGVLESNPAYAAQLQQMAGAAPNIHFHGGYTRDELPAVLAGLDAVVVPSVWYENSPLVITEALTAGVPVITSRLGGMAEMVEDGRTGLHFTMGDVPALAETLQRFVNDASLRSHLSANARDNGRRPFVDEMREMQALYHSFAERAHAAQAAEPAPAYTEDVAHAQEVAHAHRD